MPAPSIEDVVAFIGDEFDVGDVANEVDTLAGYVSTRIGRVPVRGELVRGPGPYEMEILDADPRRVKKLKIYRSTDRPGSDDRDTQRRTAAGAAAGQTAGQAPLPPGAPPVPPSELPVTRDVSVKLSPDATPPKSTRRP